MAATIVSFRSLMTVHFTSGSKGNEKGFEIAVEFITPGNLNVQMKCITAYPT